MRIIALAVILTGCAQAPIVYAYRDGLRIIRADQYVLAQACGGVEGHYDDGSLRRKGEAGIACWDAASKTIYIEDSCRGAQAIPHELAHRDGHKDPDNEGFGW